MVLEFDVALRPHTPTKQLSLIQAIRRAVSEDETDWLEWKGTADLSTKSDQFKIAKMILGLANRTVEDSLRYVEGYGYVAVGVEPHALAGTPRLDAADIDARLARYLGDQGIGFAVSHLALDGVNVMLIEVRPPRPGDPIFTLQKAFQPDGGKGTGADAGAIFVRSRTATHPATPSEVASLQERFAASLHGPDARIEIECVEGVVRLTNVEGYRRARIDGERRRLLDPLPQPLPEPAYDTSWLDRAASDQAQSIDSIVSGDIQGLLGSGSAADLGVGTSFESVARLAASVEYGRIAMNVADHLKPLRFEEERDEDEYRLSVQQYVDELEEYSYEYEIRRDLISRGLTRPEFEVRNLAEINLAELDMDILLPGDVHGFRESSSPPEDRPRPPRCWNVAPRRHPSRALDNHTMLPALDPFPYLPDTGLGPVKTAFRNSGSVELNYFCEHLRPIESDQLSRANVLVGESDSRSAISASWRATAKNVDKVFTGTMTIPVQVLDAVVLIEDA